ncbi:unnamed protein product [Lampetra fluviatilis]
MQGRIATLHKALKIRGVAFLIKEAVCDFVRSASIRFRWLFGASVGGGASRGVAPIKHHVAVMSAWVRSCLIPRPAL